MRNPFVRRRLSPKPFTRRRLAVDRLEDRLTPAAIVVNSLLDTAAPPAGVATLRSAIAAANADNNADPAHPDVIAFTVAGTIALSVRSAVDHRQPVHPGAGRRQPHRTRSRLRRAASSTVATTGTATISGLTVDGNSANNWRSRRTGPGARPTDDIVTHGNADTGGGIDNVGGTVTVARRFLNAVASSAAVSPTSAAPLTVSQTTFDNCYAISSDGGGILDWAGPASTGGGLTVVDCTFLKRLRDEPRRRRSPWTPAPRPRSPTARSRN